MTNSHVTVIGDWMFVHRLPRGLANSPEFFYNGRVGLGVFHLGDLSLPTNSEDNGISEHISLAFCIC